MHKKFKGNEKSVQVFLNPDMKRDFKIQCAKKDTTIREVLLKFITDYIKK